MQICQLCNDNMFTAAYLHVLFATSVYSLCVNQQQNKWYPVMALFICEHKFFAFSPVSHNFKNSISFSTESDKSKACLQLFYHETFHGRVTVFFVNHS